MTHPDLVDALLPLARGPVRPLSPAERERVRASVHAAVAAHPAHPVAVPHEPPARRLRTPVVAAVVVAVGMAAAATAYLVPWEPSAPRTSERPSVISPPSAVSPPPPAVSSPPPAVSSPRVGGAVAPAPPIAPPQIVPPAAFEKQRLSGNKSIVPDDATKADIRRAGQTQLIVPLKVCVDRAGAVAAVTVLKASGFPAYDARLEREVRQWRYRPFVIDGQPAAVCSIVQFVYRQR